MQAMIFPVINDKSLKLPLYLTSIGHTYQEVHVDRPQGHAHYQWLHTASGSGRLTIGHKSYDLTQGYGVFLHPNVPHVYYQTSDEWHTEWLTFNGLNASSIVSSLGFHKSNVYEIDDFDAMTSLIRKGYDIANASSEYNHLDLANYTFDALIQITKHSHIIDRPSLVGHFDRLSPVIHYLEANYHQPLDLEKLSSMIQVSPQYLCTLFKNVTGNRPSQYLNLLRVNKSKEFMLLEPQKNIGQIAIMVGFDSPSYFSSVFKRYENKTPGQFLRLYRL